MKKIKKIKIPKFWRVILMIGICCVLIAVICFFPSACDWYTDHIYQYLSCAVAWVFGLIPIPVCEAAEILEYPVYILCGVILLALVFLRKKPKYRAFCKIWFRSAAVFVLCWQLSWLLLDTIPSSGHVLGKEQADKRTAFNITEIQALYCDTVRGLNRAAEEIEIAEDGSVQFPDNEELYPQIIDAVRALSDEYPRLAGYYPPSKTPLDPDKMERTGIGGVTYSLTQEIALNKYLYPTSFPKTAAHEFAHLKGFHEEDAANFIADLALSRSENPYLRFAAYQAILYYVEPEYMEEYWSFTDELTASGVLQPMPPLSENRTSEEEKQIIAIASANSKILDKYLTEEPDLSERVQIIQDAARGIATNNYYSEPHPETERIMNDPELMEEAAKEREAFWTEYKKTCEDHYYDGVVLLLLQYYNETSSGGYS